LVTIEARLSISARSSRLAVSGEAPGEADRQGIGRENSLQVLENCLGFAAVSACSTKRRRTNWRRRDLRLRCVSQVRRRQLFNAFPDRSLAAVLVPAFAEVSVVQTKHLRCQPGRHVDTVSDMADGNIVFGLAG